MQALWELREATAQELLRWAVTTYGERFAVLSSFQDEDMALTDMAAGISPAVRVVTLDTGRLPEETYRMVETVRERYGIQVETVSPDAGEVEAMLRLHGPNLFYRSVPQRMLCCQVRKVRPLARKLQEFGAYAVGVRRAQTAARSTQPKIEESAECVKLSPLADWTSEQVRDYLVEHGVPRHPLYEQGYRSIGCAPCSRPAEPGEDERAGRWWWEHGGERECGLHFSPEGKAERTVDVLLREVIEARQGAPGAD